MSPRCWIAALIPETPRSGDADIATLGLIAGFVVMMVLNALG